MEAILIVSRLGFKGITYDNDALNYDGAKVKESFAKTMLGMFNEFFPLS